MAEHPRRDSRLKLIGWGSLGRTLKIPDCHLRRFIADRLGDVKLGDDSKLKME